jgi:hypothetical protein
MKDSNILTFTKPTDKLEPDTVLEKAKGQYSELFLVGWNKDDTMDVRTCDGVTKGDILWLLELFKHKLLAGDFD